MAQRRAGALVLAVGGALGPGEVRDPWLAPQLRPYVAAPVRNGFVCPRVGGPSLIHYAPTGRTVRPTTPLRKTGRQVTQWVVLKVWPPTMVSPGNLVRYEAPTSPQPS